MKQNYITQKFFKFVECPSASNFNYLLKAMHEYQETGNKERELQENQNSLVFKELEKLEHEIDSIVEKCHPSKPSKEELIVCHHSVLIGYKQLKFAQQIKGFNAA
jgi:hypothetical protein